MYANFHMAKRHPRSPLAMPLTQLGYTKGLLLKSDTNSVNPLPTFKKLHFITIHKHLQFTNQLY